MLWLWHIGDLWSFSLRSNKFWEITSSMWAYLLVKFNSQRIALILHYTTFNPTPSSHQHIQLCVHFLQQGHCPCNWSPYEYESSCERLVLPMPTLCAPTSPKKWSWDLIAICLRHAWYKTWSLVSNLCPCEFRMPQVQKLCFFPPKIVFHWSPFWVWKFFWS